MECLESRLVPAFYVVAGDGDASGLLPSGAGTADDPYLIGSLRSALEDSNARSGADTINFDSAFFSTARTIHLTTGTELVIADDVTIAGPGQSLLTIDADADTINPRRVFKVDDGNGTPDRTVEIKGVTITGGSAANGGGILNTEDLTLSAVKVNGNGAEYGGGLFNSGSATVSGSTLTGNFSLGGSGIYNSETGFAAITGSSITSNSVSYADGFFDSGFGGGIINAGSLSVSSSTISGNSAEIGGGGLQIDLTGTTTITDSSIQDNTAYNFYLFFFSGAGGGIANQGSLSVSNSTLSANSASAGGGLFNSGTATIQTDSSVSGNQADTRGGGIYNTYSASLSLIGATLDRNSAFNFGGGIYNLGTVTLSGSTVTDNSAGSGGGLYNGDSGSPTAIVNESYFSGNSAQSGGALWNGGSLDVAGSRLVGNSAEYGGGIEARSGNVTVSESLLKDNFASQSGGGIDTTSPAKVTISNSTIIDNTAGADGGGVGSYSSTTITNSLISGNSAAGKGGGIYNWNFLLTLINSTLAYNTATTGGGIQSVGTATITNSTIAHNAATSGGGIDNTGVLELTNTIVARNEGTNPDIQGSVVTTSDHNLVGDGTGMSGMDTSGLAPYYNQVGTFAIPIDPLLSTLDDHGGPTETFTLLAGSTAINAGNNAAAADLDYDQRGPGFPRLLDGIIDIGAVESSAPIITSANQAAFTQGQLGSFIVTTTGTPQPGLTIAGTLPAGVTFVDNLDGTATLAGIPSEAGDFDLTITADNGIAPDAVQNFTLTVTSTESPSLSEALTNNQDFTIIGATGSPTTILSVKIFDGSGNLVNTVQPFNNLTSLRVAAGDFDGDGRVGEFAVLGRRTGIDDRAEIVTYSLDAGGNATETGRFFAFAPGILGNGFIAAGDFDGDGADDIAVAQIGGGRTVVTLQIHVNTGGTFTLAGSTTIDFGVIAAPRIAAGDTDGDGLAEIVVTARTPAGARVIVFDVNSGGLTQQGTGFTWTFGVAGYSRGAFVAVGEFDPNFAGAEIVLGSNVGGGGIVDIVHYDGAGAATLVENGRLTPFGANYNAAVRVATGRLDDREVLVAGQDRFQDGQYTILARAVNTGETNPQFEQIPALTALTLDDGLAPSSPDGNRTLGPFVAFANLTFSEFDLLAPSAPGADWLDGAPDDVDLALDIGREEALLDQNDLDGFLARI